MARAKAKFDTRNETDPEKVRELGNRKKFHVHDLIPFSPKTTNQERFVDAFYDDIPIILQDGCAGTGKTYVALYMALQDVLDPGTPYEKVVIVRSPVETRKIGFMPGNEEEKQARYEIPYKEIIRQIVKYKDSYNNLKALGYIEFNLSANLRGMTFDNAIILVDEVQNTDQEECLTILTRAGQNSRIIMCGDLRQNDLFRERHGSGFEYLRKLMLKMSTDVSSTITYGTADIVRSDLVKQILIADHHLTV